MLDCEDHTVAQPAPPGKDIPDQSAPFGSTCGFHIQAIAPPSGMASRGASMATACAYISVGQRLVQTDTK